MTSNPRISVVVPIRNRENDIGEILQEIRDVLERRAEPFEIVFVDDGSTDETVEHLQALAKDDSRLKVLELAGTFGDEAALSAGLQHSGGEFVVTAAAGARDEHAGISKLLEELQRNGILVVAGRRDASESGRASSLVDALAARVMALPIHDPGCRLRAYRRSVLLPIQLPPDADYFLPALLGLQASEVSEVALAAPRPGHGIARSLAILRDLLGLRAIVADPRRAEIAFALFTAGAAAVGAIVSRNGALRTVACDAIAVLSGIVWWNARRFNRAQRDGVYRLRENDDR